MASIAQMRPGLDGLGASMHTASKLTASPTASTPVDEDAKLVRLFLRDRDPMVFSELVRKHERPVFRLVASVLGPGFVTAAEDPTQEIFVHVYHKLGGFRFAARFSTWLYRVAYRKAIDEKRKARYSRHHVSEEALAEMGSEGPDPLESSLQSERHRLLRRGVEDLGEPHRTAVLLFYWMESPVEEIAALLRTRPATVRSYLFRARARLRDTLGEHV